MVWVSVTGEVLGVHPAEKISHSRPRKRLRLLADFGMFQYPGEREGISMYASILKENNYLYSLYIRNL